MISDILLLLVGIIHHLSPLWALVSALYCAFVKNILLGITQTQTDLCWLPQGSGPQTSKLSLSGALSCGPPHARPLYLYITGLVDQSQRGIRQKTKSWERH